MVRRLDAYLQALQRWNRVYNLTAVRQPEAMVSRHLLDSLAAAPWLPASGRVLDVGSGAGLPGIPLSLVSPTLQFTLLDSSGKRTRFIQQMIAELRLDNVAVVHGRVEDHRPAAGYQAVLARAFAALADFVALSAPLCAPDGRLLAWKGRWPERELAALPPGCRIEYTALSIPGLDAARHLFSIDPACPNPCEGPVRRRHPAAPGHPR